MYILTPSWILPCAVKSNDVVNACPHTWQINGFLSLWYLRWTMYWYLNGKTFPQTSQVCNAGDGIAAWSSFDEAFTQVGADELFTVDDVVLTAGDVAFDDDVFAFDWPEIFSTFGMINGVDCDCDCDWLEWFIDGTDIGLDCAFVPDVDGCTDGIVKAFDVGGNACSELPIFPNTSWYERNWFISSMFTWTICPSALRTSNICAGGSFVSDKICALPIGCDGKWYNLSFSVLIACWWSIANNCYVVDKRNH